MQDARVLMSDVPGCPGLVFRACPETPVDPFIPYEDVLRAQLPSREDVLREAKAQSAQRQLRRRQAPTSPLL